jgi:hypothetical protein
MANTDMKNLLPLLRMDDPPLEGVDESLEVDETSEVDERFMVLDLAKEGH